jgi:hypothetical protein
LTTTSSHNKTNEGFQGAPERTGIAKKNGINGYAFGFRREWNTHVITPTSNS